MPASSENVATRLSKGRTITGWVFVGFGFVILFTVFSGERVLSSACIGAAFLLVGALLLRRLGSWKAVAPAAAILFIIGGAVVPEKKDVDESKPLPIMIIPSSASVAMSSLSSAQTTISASATAFSTVPASSVPLTTSDVPVPYSIPQPVANIPQPQVAVTTTRETLPAPAAYYGNCAEARAAGAAPIHRGEPGYRSGLDRDGDGIACDKTK
ncbi:MAG: excalibur calcium-binding domain-containing protein [Mycobacteriaceae bacterium]